MRYIPVLPSDLEDNGNDGKRGKNPVHTALERAGYTVTASNTGTTFVTDTGREAPGADLPLLHSRELSRLLSDDPAGAVRKSRVPMVLELDARALREAGQGFGFLGLHAFEAAHGTVNERAQLTQGRWDAANPDPAMTVLDLMLTLRDGTGASVHSEGALSPETKRARVTWTSAQDGRARQLTSQNGRWDYTPPPERGMGARPARRRAHHWPSEMPEKLLDALLRGYMVKLGSTPALPAGPDRGRTSYAVWDRARHGNHPALTLDSQGEVLWYQEAPPDLLWQLLFIGPGPGSPARDS